MSSQTGTANNRNSQHSFARTPEMTQARSQFDRSFALKDTFNFDYLIPILVDEVVPGDECHLSLSTFARLATQKVPIMDNMMIDYFFFFVPNRLVWNNFQKMMGEQTNPGDSISYILPQLDPFPAGGPEVNTIYDKMGLPTDIPNAWTLKNTLPLRAYNLIWNEWFRDQNLQNSVTVSKDDGPDQLADYTLLKRNRKHDYFTSSLPWPQKGTAVTLPLGTSAPVVRNPTSTSTYVYDFTSGTSGPMAYNNAPDRLTSTAAGTFTPGGNLSLGDGAGNNTGLLADLNAASSATINALRQAFAVQSLLELDARGGTRYTEIVQNHFSVTVPDFRLQRPEFLGGGSQKIVSHPVPQTAPTSGTDPQGQLAAFSTSVGSNIGFRKSFVEHGYIIGMCCARADITYQQGLNKLWNRSTRYDFFWPKLQQLGEQVVTNREIYLQGTSADDSAWGYQERYAEMRYKPSEIHGEFRSTFATSLDQWHMAEEFSALPTLSGTYMAQNTPVDRAIAVPTAPHLLFDGWFQYKWARPMLTYSVPVTLGRF